GASRTGGASSRCATPRREAKRARLNPIRGGEDGRSYEATAPGDSRVQETEGWWGIAERGVCSMFNAAGSGLVLAGLFLGASQPADAQDRVTPRKAKGGTKQGEAWAEVPEAFKRMKLPAWPLPTDLEKWQRADRARTRQTLLRCLGEMPA